MASLRARIGGTSNANSRNYRYAALDEQDVEDSPARWRERDPSNSIWSGQNRRLLKLTMAAMIIFVFVFIVFIYGKIASCETLGNCPQRLDQLWGQYSPVFAVPSELSPAVPPGCEVTFAHVLSRHGARDPTAGKTILYNATISRIQASATAYGHGYEFVRDYKYRFGSDQLTEFGERQLYDSGRHAFHRYGGLAERLDIDPFIRASGQDRVIVSAIKWTQGFFGELQRKKEKQHDGPVNGDVDSHVKNILIIPEEVGVNNTLSHGLCGAFEEGDFSGLGAQAQKTWMEVFLPPITARLNKNLPGADITDHETIFMMDMCPFDTVADPHATLSPFCSLFTADEWYGYDYLQSLGKYYGYSVGNPMGPTQGVGWVNELIARLTRSPVLDHTSSNTTLDADPKTFPLDRVLYADFSHDNDMLTIYGALGLYNTTRSELPRDEIRSPKDAGGFSAAWTVPFAGRMYVEKMVCRAPKNVHGGQETVLGEEKEELVRILINDRVVPLPNCGADRLGRCKLDAFIESLMFAASGGSWGSCSS